ncbi:MAG TPA: lysylphosphatidylglycerol synthase domain-containing protein [Candidatus Binataceae bacterium]|nr:lysylphosphatidylglycerol synthase domain-containing protein [Candidatus Binataceae bacterium]
MRRIETCFIVLAVIFYAWFISHYGLSDLLGYVRLVGWGLAGTIAFESISRIFNTFGWRATIEDYPPDLSFLELFAARIGGEAVDYTTPSAQLGGQVVMALTVRQRLRMPIGLASVAVAALAEMLGQIGFVMIALFFSLRLVPIAARLSWAIIGGFSIAVVLSGLFFFVQRKQPFTHLFKAAARLDLSRLKTDELRDAAAEADSVLADFYAHHRLRFLVSCLCYVVAWSMGPVEIYILLRLIGHPGSMQIAMLVEAAGLLVERAFFLIPGKLVSQEGGKAFILSMLGYPAGVGFVVGFLRRIKELVWVAFGLLALMIHRIITERSAGASKTPAPVIKGQVVKIKRAQGEHSL